MIPYQLLLLSDAIRSIHVQEILDQFSALYSLFFTRRPFSPEVHERWHRIGTDRHSSLAATVIDLVRDFLLSDLEDTPFMNSFRPDWDPHTLNRWSFAGALFLRPNFPWAHMRHPEGEEASRREARMSYLAGVHRWRHPNGLEVSEFQPHRRYHPPLTSGYERYDLAGQHMYRTYVRVFEERGPRPGWYSHMNYLTPSQLREHLASLLKSFVRSLRKLQKAHRRRIAWGQVRDHLVMNSARAAEAYVHPLHMRHAAVCLQSHTRRRPITIALMYHRACAEFHSLAATESTGDDGPPLRRQDPAPEEDTPHDVFDGYGPVAKLQSHVGRIKRFRIAAEKLMNERPTPDQEQRGKPSGTHSYSSASQNVGSSDSDPDATPSTPLDSDPRTSNLSAHHHEPATDPILSRSGEVTQHDTSPGVHNAAIAPSPYAQERVITIQRAWRAFYERWAVSHLHTLDDDGPLVLARQLRESHPQFRSLIPNQGAFVERVRRPLLTERDAVKVQASPGRGKGVFAKCILYPQVLSVPRGKLALRSRQVPRGDDRQLPPSRVYATPSGRTIITLTDHPCDVIARRMNEASPTESPNVAIECLSEGDLGLPLHPGQPERYILCWVIVRTIHAGAECLTSYGSTYQALRQYLGYRANPKPAELVSMAGMVAMLDHYARSRAIPLESLFHLRGHHDPDEDRYNENDDPPYLPFRTTPSSTSSRILRCAPKTVVQLPSPRIPPTTVPSPRPGYFSSPSTTLDTGASLSVVRLDHHRQVPLESDDEGQPADGRPAIASGTLDPKEGTAPTPDLCVLGGGTNPKETSVPPSTSDASPRLPSASSSSPDPQLDLATLPHGKESDRTNRSPGDAWLTVVEEEMERATQSGLDEETILELTSKFINERVEPYHLGTPGTTVFKLALYTIRSQLRQILCQADAPPETHPTEPSVDSTESSITAPTAARDEPPETMELQETHTLSEDKPAPPPDSTVNQTKKAAATSGVSTASRPRATPKTKGEDNHVAYLRPQVDATVLPPSPSDSLLRRIFRDFLDQGLIKNQKYHDVSGRSYTVIGPHHHPKDNDLIVWRRPRGQVTTLVVQRREVRVRQLFTVDYRNGTPDPQPSAAGISVSHLQDLDDDDSHLFGPDLPSESTAHGTFAPISPPPSPPSSPTAERSGAGNITPPPRPQSRGESSPPPPGVDPGYRKHQSHLPSPPVTSTTYLTRWSSSLATVCKVTPSRRGQPQRCECTQCAPLGESTCLTVVSRIEPSLRSDPHLCLRCWTCHHLGFQCKVALSLPENPDTGESGIPPPSLPGQTLQTPAPWEPTQETAVRSGETTQHDTAPGVKNPAMAPSPFAQYYYIVVAHREPTPLYLVSTLDEMSSPLVAASYDELRSTVIGDETSIHLLSMQPKVRLVSYTPQFNRTSTDRLEAELGRTYDHHELEVHLVFMAHCPESRRKAFCDAIPGARWVPGIPALRVRNEPMDSAPPRCNQLGLKHALPTLHKMSVSDEAPSDGIIIATWPHLQTPTPNFLTPLRMTGSITSTEKCIVQLLDGITPLCITCEAVYILNELRTTLAAILPLTTGDRKAAYDRIPLPQANMLPFRINDAAAWTRSCLNRPDLSKSSVVASFGSAEAGILLPRLSATYFATSSLESPELILNTTDPGGTSIGVNTLLELFLAQTLLLRRPRMTISEVRKTLNDRKAGVAQLQSPVDPADEAEAAVARLIPTILASIQMAASYSLGVHAIHRHSIGKDNASFTRYAILAAALFPHEIPFTSPIPFPSIQLRRPKESVAEPPPTPPAPGRSTPDGSTTTPTSSEHDAGIPMAVASTSPEESLKKSIEKTTEAAVRSAMTGLKRDLFDAGEADRRVVSYLADRIERTEEHAREEVRARAAAQQSREALGQGLANMTDTIAKLQLTVTNFVETFSRPKGNTSPTPTEAEENPRFSPQDARYTGPESHPAPTHGHFHRIDPEELQNSGKPSRFPWREETNGTQRPRAAQEPSGQDTGSYRNQPDQPPPSRNPGNSRDHHPDRSSSPPATAKPRPGMDREFHKTFLGGSDKDLYHVHFLVRQHRGAAMESHLLVAKAPMHWMASVAPHSLLLEHPPEFTFPHYLRYLTNWFITPTRNDLNLSEADVHTVTQTLAAQACVQNGPHPIYYEQAAVQDRLPTQHHWFVHIDLPPAKAIENLTATQRSRIPNELILYERLFSSLLRPPMSGESGFYKYSYITSRAFVQEYTNEAQQFILLNDYVTQSGLKLIKKIGEVHDWWCRHRSLTTIERNTHPQVEQLQVQALQYANTPKPTGLKDAYYLFADLKHVRAKRENESLRSYHAELMPWILARASSLHHIEMAGREESDNNFAELDPASATAFAQGNSSIVLRHLFYKMGREGRDTDFVDFLDEKQVMETLGPLPSLYMDSPNSAVPALKGSGTRPQRFCDALKRVLLMMRTMYSSGNARELAETVNEELGVAYSHAWEEGENVSEWSRRLIRQTRAPALTVDDTLLQEEEKKGLRRCLNGYYTTLSGKVSRAQMRFLYNHLITVCPVYSGMETKLSTERLALSNLMSNPITTTSQFAEAVTETDNWLNDLRMANQPNALVFTPTAPITTPLTSATRRRRVSISTPLNAVDANAHRGEDAMCPNGCCDTPECSGGMYSLQPPRLTDPGNLAFPDARDSRYTHLDRQLKNVIAGNATVLGKLDDFGKQLQLHHEQDAHSRQPSLNATASASATTSKERLYALQRMYPPRFNTRTDTGGRSMGRGDRGTSKDVDPATIEKMAQGDRPWPFYHPCTDYYSIPPADRTQMEKHTGITGPDHPYWTTTNVLSLPGQQCLLCGSKYHTPGWCDSYWALSDKASKEKGDLFVESRRARLLWNKPPPATLNLIEETIHQAPDLPSAVTTMAHDERLAAFLEDNEIFCQACCQADSDGGRRLNALMHEWRDPPTEA